MRLHKQHLIWAVAPGDPTTVHINFDTSTPVTMEFGGLSAPLTDASVQIGSHMFNFGLSAHNDTFVIMQFIGSFMNIQGFPGIPFTGPGEPPFFEISLQTGGGPIGMLPTDPPDVSSIPLSPFGADLEFFTSSTVTSTIDTQALVRAVSFTRDAESPGPVQVPEPSAIMTFTVGIGVLVFLRRRWQHIVKLKRGMPPEEVDNPL